MNKGEELYSGKAKTVYRTEDPDVLIVVFTGFPTITGSNNFLPSFSI